MRKNIEYLEYILRTMLLGTKLAIFRLKMDFNEQTRARQSRTYSTVKRRAKMVGQRPTASEQTVQTCGSTRRRLNKHDGHM